MKPIKAITWALALIAVSGILVAPLTASHHETKDVVDTAVAADDFNTLVAAVTAAELVDALKADGPYHRLRSHRCRLRQTARRHGGEPAQAREP